MAKFKPIHGLMRGKLAANVFSHNTFGDYVREKTSPVNPNSEYQQIYRTRMTYLSRYYTAVLTEEQRARWRQYASNFPIIDVFGDTIYLTGIAAFQYINQTSFLIGGGEVPNPPSTYEPPNKIESCRLEVKLAPSLSIKVYFTVSRSGLRDRLIICGAYPLRPGQMFFKNQLRFLKATTATPVSPIDITTEWVARFGEPEQNLFCACSLQMAHAVSYLRQPRVTDRTQPEIPPP